MVSSHANSTTTAASTKQYRTKELLQRGITFRKSTFATGAVPSEIRASLRAFAHMDVETTFDDILVSLPSQVSATLQDLQCAKGIVAEVERCLEDAGNEDIWTRNLWAKRVYSTTDEDRELAQSANSVWDAPVDGVRFRAIGLGRPKPDIAYGFRTVFGRSVSTIPFSSIVLEALEDDAEVNLHPRPSPVNLANFVYPGLIHEIKAANGTQQYVENQLAKSLVFALDQQEELRQAAACVNGNVADRLTNLPIVGITSIGERMTLFCAIEGSDSGVDIVEYDSFDLSQPRHALAVVMMMHSVRKWLKECYRSRIIENLCIVRDSQLRRRHVWTQNTAQSQVN